MNSMKQLLNIISEANLSEASIYNLLKGHPHRDDILNSEFVKNLSHQADFKEAPIEELSEFPEKYPYDNTEQYIYVLVLGDRGSALLKYDRYYDDHLFSIHGLQTMPNGEVKFYNRFTSFYASTIVQFLHEYTGENSKVYIALNPGDRVRSQLGYSRQQAQKDPQFGDSLAIMYKHIVPIISSEVPKALVHMQSLYRQAIEQSDYSLAGQISQKGIQLELLQRVLKDTGRESILMASIRPIVDGIAKKAYKFWALKRRADAVPTVDRWAHNAALKSKPEFNSFVETFKDYLFNNKPMD